MGGREFEWLTAELGPLSLDEALAAIPAVIERHIMLLPNIAEGSGPFQGQHHAWLHAGGTDVQQRWAAACLYLALMTQTCLDLVGAKGPTLVEGPFSGNQVYLRALRSLLGRPIIALPGSTGTAQGAALLAAPHFTPKAGMEIAGLTQDLQRYRRAWHEAIRQNGKTGSRS